MVGRNRNFRRSRYGLSGRTGRAPEAAIRHIQEYEQLSRRLGPIVSDVRQAFFDLPASSRNRLFDMYTALHGTVPGEYARATFEQWRNGQRRMSGQTAARLLDLVPKFLSVGQRYEIVRKLCVHHTPKLHRSITLEVDANSNNIATLRTAVAEFSQSPPLKAIPEHVLSTVKWLNNDDVTVARAVLAEVDKIMVEKIRQVAIIELERIESLLRGGELTSSVHLIEFPNGTLRIAFERPGLFRRIARSLLR